MEYRLETLPKYKREVQMLHDKHFISVKPALRAWAEKQADQTGAHTLLIRKGKDARWCPFCGQTFEGKQDKCPHCHKKMLYPEPRYDYWNVDKQGNQIPQPEYGKKSFSDWCYLEEITTCEGWQVDRVYVAEYAFGIGNPSRLTNLFVAYERWYKPEIKREILLGKYVAFFPYQRSMPWLKLGYSDMFVWVHSKLDYNYYYHNYTTLYPRSKFLPFYEPLRDKLSTRANRTDNAEKFRAVMKDTIAETLVKCYDKELLETYLTTQSKFQKHWRSIVLATRFGYKIGSPEVPAKDWLDYLDQLSELGKDLHSPKYLCPVNFAQAHLRAGEKLDRIRYAKEDEAKRGEREKENVKFIKAMSRYFCVVIKDKDLTLNPLKSVWEYIEEGRRMHHCVGMYYTRHDSLILSARDKFGNRVETVEVNLKDFSIVQSRGVCNKATQYHDRIINLVNATMDVIRKAKSGKLPEIPKITA